MGNRERILDYLHESPEGICDDCLSIHLDIKPRQQVNQICNQLKDEQLITREKTKCPQCKKKMLVNQIIGDEV